MSLESTNYIPSKMSNKNLYWIIEKLGYEEVDFSAELKKHYSKMYFWRPQNKDLTYVGIELNIAREKDGTIAIETRTRSGRSSLEIKHQNLTIKTIKDFFGGNFKTDYGENTLFSEDDCEPERTPISMALFVQRWILKNAIIPVQIYLDFIEKCFTNEAGAGSVYSDEIGVLPIFDALRPAVLSNNILLPYIIGAWENYLKNSFLAILKYGNTENKIIKPEKLSADDLTKIQNGECTIEECVVEKLSFQRPQTIIMNYKNLDKGLDINAAFVKPYKRRKEKLSDAINNIVLLRNRIVHNGQMDITLTQDNVKKFLENIVEVSNRIYRLFGKQYKFKPNFNF